VYTVWVRENSSPTAGTKRAGGKRRSKGGFKSAATLTTIGHSKPGVPVADTAILSPCRHNAHNPARGRRAKLKYAAFRSDYQIIAT